MSDSGNIVSKEKVQKYLNVTNEARKKATSITQNKEDEIRLRVMLKMCDDYQNDAVYFMNKGDLVRAFGAINYAHAWIDAAVRIGLLDGHGDDRLFTLP
mgnify:CR=1 FL=1|tara:strand:- start:13113 stop:13409 length:297 start_codon:yes stop_codon:yes gene_type:complete